MATVSELLNEYIEKTGLSKQGVADVLGMSRATISTYLNGKYEGNIANVERKISEYLNQVGFFGEADYSEVDEENDTGIFKTQDVKGILGVCSMCQFELGLGAIFGRSGYGKTYALQHYAKGKNVIYMECDELMSTGDIISYIEKKIGIPSKESSNWDRVNRIKDFFRSKHNQGYLLIFDEADKLLSKFTQKKLEIIRNIYDQSKVGIVIAGEPQLQGVLKRHSERFANRIDVAIQLYGLEPDDVRRFVSDYNITDEAMEEIIKIATNKNNGCFRILDRTLKNILRVRNSDRITLDTVEQATRMMIY